MAKSTARETLERALYFLSQAEAAELRPNVSADRMSFAANLEAAIIFGRSVLDHLRSEFARKPGFAAWDQATFANLRSIPVFEYFGGPAGRRNFIVHRGPEKLNITFNVAMTATVKVEVSVRAEVIRGQPWYRRSPSIILNDLTRPLRQYWHELREKRAVHAARKAQQGRSATTTVSQAFYFEDTAWRSKPAREVVRDFLTTLDPVVTDAENRFT